VIIVPCSLVLIVLSANHSWRYCWHHVNARHELSVGTVLAVLGRDFRVSLSFNWPYADFKAMQRAREVFMLYAFENALTIGCACCSVATHWPGSPRAYSVGYTVTAVAALVALARHHVNINHWGVERARGGEASSRRSWRAP